MVNWLSKITEQDIQKKYTSLWLSYVFFLEDSPAMTI